jgi:MFS family permease
MAPPTNGFAVGAVTRCVLARRLEPLAVSRSAFRKDPLAVAATLRSNRALRRLLAAWAQSCLGTGAGYVALLLLTYRYAHHSSWAISAVLLADFAPAIALGSWFGVLADRHSKRVLIVIANLLAAAAFGGLAFAHSLPLILALALLAGVGNAMLRPALRSALPLVAGEAMQSAAALFDAGRWLGITIGPLLAAGLFAISGVALPLALDGLSFLIAAGVLATIAIGAPIARDSAHDTGAGLRDGLAVALASPGMTAAIACVSGVIVAFGLLNVCEPVLATTVLHGSGSAYALLVASYGAGMVTASVLVARRPSASRRVLVRRYLDALILTAVGMFGSAIVPTVAPAALAFAATGYANALLLVSQTQLIQLRVPSSVQGRLFGAKDTVDGACYLVGLLGAGPLVAAAGVRVTLAAGSGICAVCALVAVVALRMASPAPAPVAGAGPAG